MNGLKIKLIIGKVAVIIEIIKSTIHNNKETNKII
jgi:hypothetical protein